MDKISKKTASSNYNVVVQDASGVCEYEVNVPVGVDGGTGITENSIDSGNIIIYPNPTKDQIYIELTSNSDWSKEIIIEVYDNAGRLVSVGTSLDNNKTKTIISLSGLESGIYYIKCLNKTFKNYYKVVKM